MTKQFLLSAVILTLMVEISLACGPLHIFLFHPDHKGGHICIMICTALLGSLAVGLFCISNEQSVCSGCYNEPTAVLFVVKQYNS